MDESIISITKLNNGVIKHENSKRKNHLISLFTSLEVKLSDKKSKYFDKLQYLLTAWEQIVTFSETSTESPQPAFEFLFINTLRFVLRADWSRASPGLQTHFSFILLRLGNVLSRSEAYHSILGQCRVLESVVKNPWGHSVLGKILNSQEVDLNECAEYFNFENGKVIVIRLEMLLQSKCEDIAINLSKACLHTYNSFNEDLEGFDTLDFTQDEIDYITDIYFSSLLKTKKKTELITEIKKYQLDDGLRLLQRYRTYGVGGKHNEFCKNARVWKCNKKLIDLLSNTLLANAVLHEDLLDSQSQLEDLISEWAAVQTTNDVLPLLALEMIRKFVLIAPSSKCIYPFCSFLIRNVSCKEQDFNQVARCLIRAINQNMNEIEQYRVNQERDKLKETYNQLSKGFLLISELFNECKNIRKECLLTAFSLTPTRECLQTIEAFVEKLSSVLEEVKAEPESRPESDTVAAAADSTVPDVGDSPAASLADAANPPIDIVPDAAPAPADTVPDTTDSVSAAEAVQPTEKLHDTSELNEIFKSMGVRNDEVREKDVDSAIIARQVDAKKGLAPAYICEVESLKLEDSICEDLNCILRYQRYHTLTWNLPWNELKSNCEQYLEYFEKKGFDDVELKYLDLDYNQFKDQPVNYEDCCGIEKGYEQYAVSPEESEEELSSTRRSGLSSYDSDDEIIVSHKKRRKAISSDSEGPKVKKKRGRKPKLRDPDDPRPRRPSKKKHSSDDDVLCGIGGHSDPSSLKALRQFRITGLQSLNLNDEANDEKITKQAEELNSILEDSFKLLESVDIPPVSPRFSVYDVILNETLMPNSNDTLKPYNNETQLPDYRDVSDNENHFVAEAAPEVKPKPEKRKFFVARERNGATKRKPREPKEPKPPKSTVGRAKNIKESYLVDGTFDGSPYPTLLSNNELFKRKYGNKPKNGHVLEESVTKDCVVQLPKLCDSFSNFNVAKKVLAVKSTDQNVTYSSYLNYPSYPEPKPEDALTECNRIVRSSYGFDNGTMAPTNALPAAQSCAVSDKQLENIENMLSQMDGPPAEVPRNREPSPAPLNELSNSMVADTNNDLNQTLFDFVNEQLPNYPGTGMYGSGATPNNASGTFAAAGKLVSVAVPPLAHNSDSAVSNNFNSTFVRSTAKKRNDTKKVTMVNGQLQHRRPISAVSATANGPRSAQNNDLYNTTFVRTSPKDDGHHKVDQILNRYRAIVDEFPHLKTLPAPRKRAVSGAPKKPKSRAKKNAQDAIVLDVAFNKNTFSSESYGTNARSVAYTVDTNVYRNNSKSELPISSTRTSSQIYSTAQYQPATAHTETPAQTYYAVAQPPKAYVSPAKMDESSGTLKALLMQGSDNVNVSMASKVYDSLKYNYPVSSIARKFQAQASLLAGEAVGFSDTPKTYNQYEANRPPDTVKNRYASLVNTPVPSSATNVSVCIPKLKLPKPTMDVSNGDLMSHYNVLNTVPSSSAAYTVSQSYASRQICNSNVTQADPSNAVLMKGYESMMNNFQVRIPRIDCSGYNKPSYCVDQTYVNNTDYSDREKIHGQNVQLAPSNVLDSVNIPNRNGALKPLVEVNTGESISDQRIAGQVEEFDCILKRVQATVDNNQFSMTSSALDSKNDPLKLPPIVYDIQEEGVQISIPESPECGFNFEDYLNCLQQT